MTSTATSSDSALADSEECTRADSGVMTDQSTHNSTTSDVIATLSEAVGTIIRYS